MRLVTTYPNAPPRRAEMAGRSEAPTFDSWQQAMMSDGQRNALLESAIRKSRPAGKTVLEIGTGPGLPAIKFAEYGAARVFTCEMNPQLAAAAQEVVSRSGYAKQITILPVSSTEALDRHLLDAIHFDIIFTETLSGDVIREGFFAVGKDIRRCMQQDSRIMPCRVEQWGCAVESSGAWAKSRFPLETRGVDLTPLKKFRPPSVLVNPNEFGVFPLSKPELLRVFDYRHAYLEHENAYAELSVQFAGTCHGLLTYFRAHFGEVVISTGSDLDRCPHWSRAFHPLSEPVRLPGDSVATVRMTPEGWAAIDRVD